MAPKNPARPVCTHITMIRIHGTQECQLCHKPPSIGFLYRCKQDVTQQISLSKENPKKCKKLLHANPERQRHPQSLAEELKSLKSNESIIKAAEQGHYSPEQLEILKDQKKKVKETIEKSLQGTQVPTRRNSPLGVVHASENPTTVGIPQQSNLKRPFRRTSTSRAFESCDLRVCHTCRPSFRERCFVPLESALRNEICSVRKWVPHLMPVMSASIIKSIGLQPQQGWNSNLESIREIEELDMDAKSIKLLGKTSSYGFRESLARDFRSLIENDDATTRFDKYNGDYEEDLHLEDGKEEDILFDLDLWKDMSDALLRRAANTPLPCTDSDEELENLPTISKSLGLNGTKDENATDETGTEPETFGGGLALTEEAFENQSPDIITSV